MAFAHLYAFCSCSVSSLVLLGASLGLDGGGVSQSMNLIWHNSIKKQVHRIFTSFSFPPMLKQAIDYGNEVKSGVNVIVNEKANGYGEMRGK